MKPSEPGSDFFKVGCLLEGGAGLLGLGLCVWLVPEVLAGLSWGWTHWGVGLVATLPPLGFFFWAVYSPAAPFRAIRELLQSHFLPHVQGWGWVQIIVISILAGVGEEVLFRGAVQGGLALLVGPLAALILASLAFGLCHALTWGYILVTTLMGAYLGLLWIMTGNLLVPIVTHGLYDAVALGWLILGSKGRPPR